MNTFADQSGAPDAELLERCLCGERDAFGALVSRYQSLVCSVAYSIIGDLGRSEDVAQDAFVAAWRQLGSLEDRGKFKAWLCGIARNLALGVARGRRDVENMEAVPEPAAPAQQEPDASAVSREEETLVWKALSELPEIYREPLVLFYREDHSIARVAVALELSEDAVKQRLSRGREMLREQVAAMVEGALKRSRPGAAFTLAVMAAIPVVTASSASAATLAVAGKAGPALKAAATAGLTGAAAGIAGGLAGGLIGTWATWQTARYPRQRDYLRRSVTRFLGITATYVGLLFGVRFYRGTSLDGRMGVLVTLACTFAYVAYTLWWSFMMGRRWRRIAAEEQATGAEPLPETFLLKVTQQRTGRRWRSSVTLFGLPLIDVSFGNPAPGERTGVARGWIALGDTAYGLVFAFGSMAFAPIAIGGLACGGVAFGGFAAGVLPIAGFAAGIWPFGGFALGGWAIGGFAAGWCALGGGAFGWHAAKGGLAWAHGFALGGSAAGAHANDAAARAAIGAEPFFRHAEALLQSLMPIFSSRAYVPCMIAGSLLFVVLSWAISYPRRKGNRAATGE